MKKGIIVTVICAVVAVAYLVGSDLSGLHAYAAEPKPGG